MAGATFATSTELTTVDCGKCGGTYAIQERYRQNKYETGGSWTCPYCKTGWGYSGNSENEKLKRQLEAERDAVVRERQKHDQTKAELRETESRRRAEKAAKTRIKNRVAHGVCPCCNRTFKDLQAHMQTKHPDYATSEATP